jgi:hypothetical protein
MAANTRLAARKLRGFDGQGEALFIGFIPAL